MKLIPLPWRTETLRRLTAETWDLLVVGGGIVGAGIARDAAMRGLRVALVEQHDFAFGTSSRSSRLLHGGLRYLAQGRVGLVHEASVEKRLLHEIAPHLTQPLRFVFPTYRANPHWVLWQLKLGVRLYDLLCGGKNFGPSAWLTGAQTLAHVPGLSADGLQGAVSYFDGFTNDARLTLDTLRSAAAAGAVVVNYCRFEEAARNEMWDCLLEDCFQPARFRVRAHAVVNAAGPWADALPHSRVRLRLTAGIHLVVDAERLRVPDAVVMAEGKRILFAIPWGEKTILGTTDTDYSGVPEAVQVSAGDVSNVLRVANHYFPTAQLTEADVISSWAGLRPLIARGDGSPSDISRSHEIRCPEPGWFDVAGGKLTTYRLMAEQTVDRILRQLGRPAAPCRTAREPLLRPAEVAGVSGVLPPRFSPEVVEHYCAKEWAVHLDDVMVRRAGWHYLQRDPEGQAEQASRWMAQALNWPEARRLSELAAYEATLRPALPTAA